MAELTLASTSEHSEAADRSLSAPRMVGLETACEVLGDKGGIKHVAELIGCSERALYAKRNGDTTITNLEVRLIARELARVAERCARVSDNLFKEIGGKPVDTVSKGTTA
ncbi:hypothetical protein [uncultured Sphingomonas sp.]|uniref:hypothetical protein n=1 Tax=uncultured Sphingomonas sp. TaxID=158754 RepID=UPI0025CD8861|nr:hypothetical protein [uncultured Sphingomonas sp.]